MKNYPIGDNTMVVGVKRSPWLAKPDAFGGWIFADLPQHGNSLVNVEKVAENLYRLLYKELLNATMFKKTVGVLLSGGMDSRITAGILKRMQENGDFNGRVVAINWGIDNSRDVIYAQRIASLFKWDYIYYSLNAEVLYNNIRTAALRGAEYSPIHLHAMNSVANLNNMDLIIASSFGDSVGRAEYSGYHIKDAPDLMQNHLNHFSLVLKKIEKEEINNLKNEIRCYNSKFYRNNLIEYREIDYQINYMRRQLVPCMEIIDDIIPVYQAFGHPSIYGYMWNIDVSCRNDHVYKHLLKLLPNGLYDIPWSRTGRLFGEKKAKPRDEYLSRNNQYGMWLRKDCKKYIMELLTDGSLQKLGIFNTKALEFWLQAWPLGKSSKANRLDEKISWLASFSYFLKHYGIEGSRSRTEIDFTDIISIYRANIYNKLYQKYYEVFIDEP